MWQSALSFSQAKSLKAALHNDASGSIYSSAVSIGDAIQALHHNFFTWATVKLYYSTFYLMRGLLALEANTAILYSNRSPYTWRCKPGEIPERRKGNTHKVVLNEFEKSLPNHTLLSQKIGLSSPLDWLMNLREEANYKIPKFQDPEAPIHFKFIQKSNMRQLLGAYALDAQQLYMFDEDHAILAFPIGALKHALKMLKNSDAPLDSIEQKYLISIFSDKNGPFTEFKALLENPT